MLARRVENGVSPHEFVPSNPSSPRLRVALINPPDSSSRGTSRLIEPLGLGYLASYARLEGFHVDLFDLAALRNPVSLRDVGLFNDYTVYGLSTYSDSIYDAVALASAIKAASPDSCIVFGGYHASLMDVEVLEDFACVDVVVRDEGEASFAEILRSLAADSSNFAAIDGITWRTAAGVPERNRNRVTWLSQDSLPFPETKQHYCSGTYVQHADPVTKSPLSTIAMVSSRGCPKRCTFCTIVLVNPLWRPRSPESMLAEVASHVAVKDVRHIWFQDANLFVDPRRLLAFGNRLKKLHPNITWSGTATPDHVVRHAAAIQELASLNCIYLELGIESGNDASLKRFAKGTNVAINEAALRILGSAGIACGVDFIMFDSSMCFDDLAENLAFLERNELLGYWPSDLLFQEVVYYPGTALRKDLAPSQTALRHALPRAEFADTRVSEVFDSMKAYRERVHQTTIALVAELELAARQLALTSDGDGERERQMRQRQQAFSHTLALKHLSYRFFRGQIDASGSFTNSAEHEPVFQAARKLLARLA